MTSFLEKKQWHSKKDLLNEERPSIDSTPSGMFALEIGYREARPLSA